MAEIFEHVNRHWIAALRKQTDGTSGCVTGKAGVRLLLLDDCSCHSNVRFLRAAREANVLVVVPPPNTTPTNQPLDVACNNVLKNETKKEVTLVLREVGNSAVQQAEYLDMLGKVYNSCKSVSHPRTYILTTMHTVLFCIQSGYLM